MIVYGGQRTTLDVFSQGPLIDTGFLTGQKFAMLVRLADRVTFTDPPVSATHFVTAGIIEAHHSTKLLSWIQRIQTQDFMHASGVGCTYAHTLFSVGSCRDQMLKTEHLPYVPPTHPTSCSDKVTSLTLAHYFS